MGDKAKALAAIREIVDIILDTLEATAAMGGGVSSGAIYSALMGIMSIDTYTTIMDILEAKGCVRKSGHVYYFVKKLEA